jgi:molybdopterin synthase catalytic subunit
MKNMKNRTSPQSKEKVVGFLSREGKSSFKIMNEIMKMTKAEPEWKHNTTERERGGIPSSTS